MGVVSLKRLLNQSNLKSWSYKMIKKSLEAYFFYFLHDDDMLVTEASRQAVY